jgi:hypothetical protein
MLWAFLFSIVFHFTVGPVIAWLFSSRFTAGAQRQQPIETISMQTSAIRLERRPQPRHREAIQPPAPQPLPQPQPRPQQLQRQAPPRRELARINPRASISVPRAAARHALSLSEQLAQEHIQYTQTIARLRRETNPLISAAQPASTPAATKRYTYDFSGSIGSPNIGEGILTPNTSWQVGDWDYYYVDYWVLYPDGTSETGKVPWPVRFPRSQDPLRLGWRRLPLAGPLPDFVLPAGTNMHPLAAYCFEHHLAYCPIARD